MALRLNRNFSCATFDHYKHIYIFDSISFPNSGVSCPVIREFSVYVRDDQFTEINRSIITKVYLLQEFRSTEVSDSG